MNRVKGRKPRLERVELERRTLASPWQPKADKAEQRPRGWLAAGDFSNLARAVLRPQQSAALASSRPLAFKYLSPEEHGQVLDTLQHGDIIWTDPRPLFGSTLPQLVWVKGRNGKTLQAVFKGQSREGAFRAETPMPLYKQEVTAYRLSEVTGLGLIPPTVERTLRGEVGSLQLLVGATPTIRKSEMLPGAAMPPAGETPLTWLPQIREPSGSGRGGPVVDRTDFDKLMAFDRIFKNRDRGPSSLMVPVVGIDQGLIGSVLWSEEQWRSSARRLSHFVTLSGTPSVEAKDWVQGIDERAVGDTLREQGYPQDFISSTHAHLRHVKATYDAYSFM